MNLSFHKECSTRINLCIYLSDMNVFIRQNNNLSDCLWCAMRSSSRLKIDDFLAFAQEGKGVCFDVRTPAEFEQGHIPGAVNLPLFTNEERVIIGTLYKQQGREDAILRGLDMIGPKMRGFIEQVRDVVGTPDECPRVYVHCWRGGMRSESMAWLLSFYGYKGAVLDGGYKAFRQYVLATFDDFQHPLLVLGGSTGSKKTELLHELNKLGEQTIDLEAIANHRGSSFGGLQKGPQPSVEMFENLLATELRTLDNTRHVWVEDESRMIGSVILPKPLYDRMQQSTTYVICIPEEERLAHLINLYGKASKSELIEGFVKIRKRLGGLALAQALDALDRGDLEEATKIALTYYDKAYNYGLEQRSEASCLVAEFGHDTTLEERAACLVERAG